MSDGTSYEEAGRPGFHPLSPEGSTAGVPTAVDGAGDEPAATPAPGGRGPYWTRTFWEATAERAVKSVAQGAIGTGLLAAGSAVDVWDLDWSQIVSAGVMMGLLSILTSIASAPLGAGTGPSIVGERLTREHHGRHEKMEDEA